MINRCLSLFFVIAAFTHVVNGQAPDFSANFIQGPASAQCGTPITVNRDVTNIGGALPGPFSYSIRLSTNQIISANDLQVGSFQGTTLGLIGVSITIPATVTPGFYFYGLLVDPANGEVNTANNAVASSGTVQVITGGPTDLVAVAVSGPGTVNPGQAITLNRNIANAGCPLASFFGYTLRLSADTTINALDPVIATWNSTTLGSLPVTATIPPGQAAGNYYYGLVVDPGFGELNLSNNTVASLSQVTVAGTLPTITSVTPDVGPASGGTLVNIAGTNFLSGTTVNFGGMPALNVTIASTTLLTCQTPPSPTGGAAAVLVEVNNTQGTAILVAGFSYGSTFPGSGEDLLLQSGVGGPVDSVAIKSASPGDNITIAMSSPNGGFTNDPVVVVGQIYFTAGAGPTATSGFPELQIDPLNSVVILDGTRPTPFGPIVFPTAGSALTLPFFYPGGLGGNTGRVQAFAISGLANNGFFAASNAVEIVY